jgi:mRNA interferase YafQ
MYHLQKTNKFVKSYKKIKKSGDWNEKNQKDLIKLINSLLNKEKLPQKYQDHQLKGEFKEYRECHIKGDLLLIYKIIEKELVLVLVNIGSHSSLNL